MSTALVERARHGDREAFTALAAGNIDRLNAVARLILRDPDLADDAVQQALVRCWRFLPSLRDPGQFEGWLYRLLIHTAKDELRKSRRIQTVVKPLSVEPSVSDGSAQLAMRDQLESGFRRLSIDHRVIVVLHHYMDLSLVEVASALGIPPGTAKSRYHYAMSALRSALEAEARLAERGEVIA